MVSVLVSFYRLKCSFSFSLYSITTPIFILFKRLIKFTKRHNVIDDRTCVFSASVMCLVLRQRRHELLLKFF